MMYVPMMYDVFYYVYIYGTNIWINLFIYGIDMICFLFKKRYVLYSNQINNYKWCIFIRF